MSVRILIAPAPVPAASGLPDSGSTTPVADAGGAGQPEACRWCPPTEPVSEAMLIACALAGWGNTLTLPTITEDQAECLIAEALGNYRHDVVLDWRCRVDAGEQRTRWNAAVAATGRLYSRWMDVSGLRPVAPAPPPPAESVPAEQADAEQALVMS